MISGALRRVVITVGIAVAMIMVLAIPANGAVAEGAANYGLTEAPPPPVSIQIVQVPCGPFSSGFVQIGYDYGRCTAFNGSGFMGVQLRRARDMCTGHWSGTIFYTDPSRPWADLLYFDFSSGACFGLPYIDIWGISIK
jgi:hypothetical protein